MKDIPAIAGGNPVREEFLPYAQPWLDEEGIAAVVEVLHSIYLTTGPKIEEFEKKFASFVDAKYAVAIANGTAALHAAVFAAGIGHGDEVITTPMTFAASANCVLYQGGRPVFADILEDTYNIDPAEIERNVTPWTKAVIPVHFTGQPVDLDEIHRIAHEYNLIVIEDAAHALGAEYKGKKIGGLSDMTIFSFHPVKHITTGEGGAVVTNSKAYYEKMLAFRSHGMVREKERLTEYHGPWYHEMHYLGYNYRITDVQCALGISQLKKLDVFLEKRMAIVDFYNDRLCELDMLEIPVVLPGVVPAWHLYVIRLRDDRLSRRDLYEEMHRSGIGVQVHYLPVYWHPYYQKLGYPKGLCPAAENHYQQALSLPLFPTMDLEDCERVVSVLQRILCK